MKQAPIEAGFAVMRNAYRILPVVLAASLAGAGCFAKSGHLHHSPLSACNGNEAPESLRLVSYNIKAGVDSSLEAVIEVLRALDGDIVALQEVDFEVDRTGGADQTEEIARALGYPHFAFAGARPRQGGHFGVAVLSRFPLAGAGRVDLHDGFRAQPRAAVDTTVCVGEAPLRFVSVHADYVPSAARRDVRTLRARVMDDIGLGVIIAGDLNVKPHTRGPGKLLALGLADLLAARDDGPTFPGFPGPKRIDYFFADGPMAERAGDGGVVQTRVSDHYPIWVDVPVRPLLAVHGLAGPANEDEELAYDLTSQDDEVEGQGRRDRN